MLLFPAARAFGLNPFPALPNAVRFLEVIIFFIDLLWLGGGNEWWGSSVKGKGGRWEIESNIPVESSWR